MTRYDAPSRCSSGTPVTFRWYGYPTAELGEDLDTATGAFLAAITPAGRVWNPWAQRMVRAEFRDRVLAASRGELVPIDEVKAVDQENPPPLYEIRWQGIAVTDYTDGQAVHRTALVRMYHSEPPQAAGHFVGHHIHEKLVDVDDIYAAQDDEIRVAKGFYDIGEPTNWGIAPS